MRHKKSGRKLNRTTSHRLAMLRNMSISLFKNEVVITTLPKSKELRSFVEPLITFAKVKNLSNRRLLFSRIRNNEVVNKLFNDFGLRFKDREGGYIRILKFGFRSGDNAPLAYIDFVGSKIINVPEVVCKKETLEK